MRDPPRASVVLGDGRSVELGGGGGSAWRCIAGAGRSGVSRGLWPVQTSAKETGGLGVAHRAQNWMGKRRRIVDGEVLRRR